MPAGSTPKPTTAQPTVQTTDQGQDQQTGLAGEHVTGDDPARTHGQEGGFHDSVSGRPVDESGQFLDGSGEVEKHRVVANNWPELREDQTK